VVVEANLEKIHNWREERRVEEREQNNTLNHPSIASIFIVFKV
jgi:hypothetical protein